MSFQPTRNNLRKSFRIGINLPKPWKCQDWFINLKALILKSWQKSLVSSRGFIALDALKRGQWWCPGMDSL